MHTTLLLIASFILLMRPNTSEQPDPVKSLAISPDSRLIVSASSATVTLWDIETCSSLSVLGEHQDTVNSVAYSPDGQHVVSGSDDKTAIIWDIATGEQLHTLQHTDEVMVVNYSPNGHFIVTGSRNGILTIWDADTGEKTDHFILEDRIWSAEFSPNNERVLIADGRQGLMLDVATKTILYRVKSPNSISLRYATFHPSGLLFATTGPRSALAYVWDIETGELHMEMSQRVGDFHHLAYSPDGKQIAAIERSVAINPGDIQYNLDVQDTNIDERVFHAFYFEPMRTSAFSHDNQYFVVNFGREIRIYSTMSWEVICSLT